MGSYKEELEEDIMDAVSNSIDNHLSEAGKHSVLVASAEVAKVNQGKDLNTILAEVSEMGVKLSKAIDESQRIVTVKEAVVLRLATMAMNGNMAAIHEWFKRTEDGGVIKVEVNNKLDEAQLLVLQKAGVKIPGRTTIDVTPNDKDTITVDIEPYEIVMQEEIDPFEE